MVDNTTELSTENQSLKNEIISFDGESVVESKAKLLKQFDNDKRASLKMSRLEKQLKKY